jgi:TolB-like protein/DNA-binding winged helix-turn-helix (wHTH) protein/Tfp pilus assembly protein PilF
MAENVRLPDLPERVRFGPYEADLRSGELTKHGVTVRLADRPFRILCILLREPGRLVPREQLRQELWQADTFVDFDHGISSAVNKLRQALCDSADRPRYIETVGRRGYRFIAEVAAIPIGISATRSADASHASAAPALSPVPKVQPAATSLPTQGDGRGPMWVALAVSAVLMVTAIVILARMYSARVEEAAKPIRSVAVLPLENLSHDEEQEYFADGITDELITNLAKVTQLRVISRTSVERYKGSKLSLPEIARQLKVDALVEGSISRSTDRILLRAQLVQVDPERHLWAESYDRPLHDAVTLQNELAQQIAREVKVKLEPAEVAELTKTHPVDPAAHELYLRGRYAWNLRNVEAYKRAVQYFQQSIQADPNYAEAYAGLADAYSFLTDEGLSTREGVAKATAAARTALELDPSLAEPHATLGLLAVNYAWNWSEAEAEYRKAIELNPNYPTAHHWYGEFLAVEGRFDEGMREIGIAHQLDPLSLIINTDEGEILFGARRYGDSIKQLRKTVEMDPKFSLAAGWLAYVLANNGQYAEALEVINQHLTSEKDPVITGVFIGPALAKSGERARALNILADLLRREKTSHIDAAVPMYLYIALNDKENAFKWMEKAVQQHSASLIAMKVSPAYDPLRSDPRFESVLKRVIPQ